MLKIPKRHVLFIIMPYILTDDVVGGGWIINVIIRSEHDRKLFLPPVASCCPVYSWLCELLLPKGSEHMMMITSGLCVSICSLITSCK